MGNFEIRECKSDNSELDIFKKWMIKAVPKLDKLDINWFNLIVFYLNIDDNHCNHLIEFKSIMVNLIPAEANTATLDCIDWERLFEYYQRMDYNDRY